MKKSTCEIGFYIEITLQDGDVDKGIEKFRNMLNDYRSPQVMINKNGRTIRITFEDINHHIPPYWVQVARIANEVFVLNNR